MLEYLPWSKKVLAENLQIYSEGRFLCLDIELGGECNYHCVYCDSPDRGKCCTLLTGITNIEKQIKNIIHYILVKKKAFLISANQLASGGLFIYYFLRREVI